MRREEHEKEDAFMKVSNASWPRKGNSVRTMCRLCTILPGGSIARQHSRLSKVLEHDQGGASVGSDSIIIKPTEIQNALPTSAMKM